MSSSNSSGEEDHNSPSTKRRRRSDEKSSEGPCLPPDFVREGPSLPPDFVREGPALPPDYSHNDDADIIGPLPSSGPQDSHTAAADQIARRAENMKRKLQKKNEPVAPQRESWMTQIPENVAGFGLTNRKFTSGGAERDCSGWTDTPADRARKAQDAAEGKVELTPSMIEDKQIKERDEKLSKEIKKYNKHHRGESLLEMHQKKSKKEKRKKEKKEKKKKKDKDKDEKKKERVPFDRDRDLKVGGIMDDAKRAEIIKRSSELTSRFGHGSQKFI